MIHLFKKLLIGAIVISFVISIPFFFVLVTFQDDDYRNGIIWYISENTDYVLDINGDFTLDLTLSPIISARDIRFRSDNNELISHIDMFEIQVDLLPLFSNIIQIKQLKISNAGIDVRQVANRQEEDSDGEFFDYIPVLELATFRNIRYTHEFLDASPPLSITIDNLQLNLVDISELFQPHF